MSTVMTRSVSFWLLVLLVLVSLSDVNGYPKLNFFRDKNSHPQNFKDLSWRSFKQLENNTHTSRQENALQKIQELFSIRNQSEKLAHHKVPQFMIELYNIISEDTQTRNPYNAKVVRSFIEKDTSLSNFYFFNVSGLEINESVLGAELHLYRKKMPLGNFSSHPYYLVKLYQVLNDRSLDVPDLHRLLDVYYVDTDSFGWEVFNVTQAVFGWLSGEPNLGLLVTASNLFENKVEFFRRNNHHNKQPILVLFDDIRSNLNQPSKPSFDVYEYQNDKEDRKVKQESEREEEEKEEDKINLENNYNDKEHSKFKRLQKDGQLEEAMLTNRYEPEFFQRSKRNREKKDEKRERNEPASYDSQEWETETLMLGATKRRRRDVASKKRRIVSKNHTRRIPKMLTSMDIYERAKFRERLGQKIHNRSSARQRRSMDNENAITIHPNTTECIRHELYVDFQDIGLSSIIAPPGYSAYQCKGMCESPLSQDQWPTNHATIQAIVHKVGPVKDVEKPCCVPIKLQSISILFLDKESVVLKNYEDMVAERCGCR